MHAIVTVEFSNGGGRITAKHYRDGEKVAYDDMRQTGDIRLTEAQADDVIHISGACTGRATVRINVPTSPATPYEYHEGRIETSFSVL